CGRAAALAGKNPDLLDCLGFEALALGLVRDLDDGTFAVPLRQRDQQAPARTERRQPDWIRVRKARMHDDHVGRFANVPASVAMDDIDVAIRAKVARGALGKPLVAFDRQHPALWA